MKKIIVLIALISNLGFSYPYFCSEPSKPVCINFNIDNTNYDSCKYDVEKYIQRMKDYQECILKETTDEANKVIKKFNCQVSGDFYCF